MGKVLGLIALSRIYFTFLWQVYDKKKSSQEAEAAEAAGLLLLRERDGRVESQADLPPLAFAIAEDLLQLSISDAKSHVRHHVLLKSDVLESLLVVVVDVEVNGDVVLADDRIDSSQKVIILLGAELSEFLSLQGIEHLDGSNEARDRREISQKFPQCRRHKVETFHRRHVEMSEQASNEDIFELRIVAKKRRKRLLSTSSGSYQLHQSFFLVHLLWQLRHKSANDLNRLVEGTRVVLLRVHLVWLISD